MVGKRKGEDERLRVCTPNGSWILLRPLTFELPRTEGVGVQKDWPRGGFRQLQLGKGSAKEGSPSEP